MEGREGETAEGGEAATDDAYSNQGIAVCEARETTTREGKMVVDDDADDVH